MKKSLDLLVRLKCCTYIYTAMKVLTQILLLLFINVAISSCKEAGQKLDAENYEVANLTELELVSVIENQNSVNEVRITFQDKNDKTKKLEMLVGNYEGQTLAIAVSKKHPDAPLTLDLLEDAITQLGYSVKSVLINGIVNNVYTSEILCAKDLKILTLKSRAIDAITLAEKVKCPIYIDSGLMGH
jgi:bifunctional DNase/RNase